MMGFSGHRMAQNIMMQTSPMMQTMQYVDSYRSGRLFEPISEPRVDWLQESRKIDLTPTFKPMEIDPYRFQARLEERFEEEKLFRGLSLIAADRRPDTAFDFASIRTAETTFNISRQKDSSELMLDFLASRPKMDAIYPAPEKEPSYDYGYARDVLDIDIPTARPVVPIGFSSWVRDTLEMEADYFMPLRNMGEAVKARDLLDMDFTDRFMKPVFTRATDVPGVRDVLELTNSGLRPFSGNRDLTIEYNLDLGQRRDPLRLREPEDRVGAILRESAERQERERQQASIQSALNPRIDLPSLKPERKYLSDLDLTPKIDLPPPPPKINIELPKFDFKPNIPPLPKLDLTPKTDPLDKYFNKNPLDAPRSLSDLLSKKKKQPWEI